MFLYLSLIISYLRHAVTQPNMLLVGAECRMQWVRWEPQMSVRIISFAPEPVGGSLFDEYGWSDEVFLRLPNFSGLLRFIWNNRSRGCSFSGVNLIYADIAE